MNQETHRRAIALTFLLAATPVVAAPSADTAVQPPAAKPGNAGDKICENIVSTGSRIASKRVCMTREQWAQRQRDDRDEIERDQRSVNIGCVLINTHTPTPSCN